MIFFSSAIRVMVVADAEAQKSIELAKEKKARIANTAQTARCHEKYSRHSLIYSEPHSSVGPTVQNDSLF
jgi:hypothetical protein